MKRSNRHIEIENINIRTLGNMINYLIITTIYVKLDTNVNLDPDYNFNKYLNQYKNERIHKNERNSINEKRKLILTNTRMNAYIKTREIQ